MFVSQLLAQVIVCFTTLGTAYCLCHNTWHRLMFVLQHLAQVVVCFTTLSTGYLHITPIIIMTIMMTTMTKTAVSFTLHMRLGVH